MSDDREYLTTEALAAAAGVSLPTLRRHVKAALYNTLKNISRKNTLNEKTNIL